MTGSPPVLYLLMRTDLASLNPGKAVAQGSHAANQCVSNIREIGRLYEAQIAQNAASRPDEDTKTDPAEIQAPPLLSLLAEWEAQTGHGFGTCIVLGVKEAQMRAIVPNIRAARNKSLIACITHDPTYPIRDGEVTHLIPLDTCAYVFGRKDDAAPFVAGLDLMA
jgi:hypothetical protein